MAAKKVSGDPKKGRGSKSTTINTGSGVNPSPTPAVVSPSLSNWNTANGSTGSNPYGNVQPVLTGGPINLSPGRTAPSTPPAPATASPAKTPVSPSPAASTAPAASANPYSSSAGAAGALFGDGGPMYGSTAPAATPPAQPSYNPPASISSAPSFSGMATEPPPATPAPAFAEPTYVAPKLPTNTTPTASNPQGMTLEGVRSAIMWNSGGVAPLDNSAEFRARAAQLGYTSWEGSDGPVVMSTPGGGVMPVYVPPKP